MPKSDQARAAELLTVPDFVKAAQDGDRRADAMVAKALEWTQVRIRPTPTPIWIGRRPGQSACDVLIDAYATGTDGRLLVKVLDFCVAQKDCPDADWPDGRPWWPLGMPQLLYTIGEIIEKHDCNIHIAACAALAGLRGRQAGGPPCIGLCRQCGSPALVDLAVAMPGVLICGPCLTAAVFSDDDDDLPDPAKGADNG